jgi:tetratricopeptide (TPR) repeat protein
MRHVSTPVTSLALLLIAAPALASFGGGPKNDPPPPSTAPPPGTSAPSSEQQSEAQQIYSIAYEEVAKAKKDLADGKTKNAEKKFRRAMDRGERAAGLDPKYHEAWNLVGFCARKLNDYDKAFASYEKCLALKPDYAPAREYLGEAWLEKGDPKKAREQLEHLEDSGAITEAQNLKSQILAYEAAHPAAAEAPKTEAAPDTTTKAAGSDGR